METILVPAPPASAFNKDRPLSDLLKQQLRHFQHVEARLPLERRSNFSPQELATPAGAARYIAHMTRLLRGLPVKTAARRLAAVPDAGPPQPLAGLSFAGAVESAPAPASATARNKRRKAAPTASPAISGSPIPKSKHPARPKGAGGKS